MSQKELDARFKSKHGDKEAVMERMGEYDKTKIELLEGWASPQISCDMTHITAAQSNLNPAEKLLHRT